MLEPFAPELRQELAAARVAALHRSAGVIPPGPLRRAAGSALVRLGLRLGYGGSVPPRVLQAVGNAGAGIEPGTRALSHEAAAPPPFGWPTGQANAITLRIPS